jgi:hypothetical protein
MIARDPISRCTAVFSENHIRRNGDEDGVGASNVARSAKRDSARRFIAG